MTYVNPAAGQRGGGAGIRISPWTLLRRRAVAAAVLSAVVNAVIYLVASAAGAFPPEVVLPASGQPVTLGPVIAMSAAGALGGAACYALLRLVSRRPETAFRWIAAVVLVLSFATPFTLPGAPAAMIASLELMHVVVAAATVVLLTGWSGPGASSRP